MGSELLRLLEQEVGAEVDGVLAEALTRVDEIVGAARRDADEIVAAARDRLERQRIDGHMRSASAARLRATALILQIKDDLIREILDRAATAARDALRDPSRRRVALRTFIREATAALGTERVTVYAAPTDAAEVREACAGLGIEADVRVDPSVEDGVRVASAESRAVVENTLASRMDRMRHGLAPKVAAILWSSTP